MDELKQNAFALYIVVLLVSIIVDTFFGLFFDYSMFNFWTQFFLGIIVAGIGAWMVYWVLAVLERNGVPLGHAEKPVGLIETGPYALTRNPLYIALTVMYAGVAILFDSPLAFLALIPVLRHVKTRIVPAEEAILAEAFGAAYERYKAKVGRWF